MPTTSRPLANGTWHNVPWIITEDHALIINPDNTPATYIFDPECFSKDQSPWISYNSIIQSVLVNENIDTTKMTSCKYLFCDLTYLQTADLRLLDTSNVTDMSCMFYHCKNLISVFLPEKPGCMNHIYKVAYMFSCCSKLQTVDLHNFSSHKMEYIAGMFYKCSSLSTIDISNFKFNSNRNNGIDYLFCGCTSLTSIKMFSGPLNTDSLQYVFGDCSSLPSLDCSNIYIIQEQIIECESTFTNCRTLKRLNFFSNLPYQPVSLDLYETFKNCHQLHSLSLPNYLLVPAYEYSLLSKIYGDFSFKNCDQLTNISNLTFKIKSNAALFSTAPTDSILEYLIKTHQLLPDEDLLPLFVEHQKVHLIPYLLNEYISSNLFDPVILQFLLNMVIERISQNKYKTLDPSDLSLLLTVLHQYLPET